MSTPRFKPLVESVIEETIIIEETVLLEETCTTLTEEIFEVSANQNSGDIAKYLELLDFWKKKAIEELKEILDEYAHATKKLNQLQQKHFLTKSFPSWLNIEYSIDRTYDQNDEFYSQFESLKNDYLKKAIELDLKATQKKLIFLSPYLQDPTLILKKVYQDFIQANVQTIPKNLKESWDSAMKRCEYAFSQDATQLLESKLVEIEAAAKEPLRPTAAVPKTSSPKSSSSASKISSPSTPTTKSSSSISQPSTPTSKVSTGSSSNYKVSSPSTPTTKSSLPTSQSSTPTTKVSSASQSLSPSPKSSASTPTKSTEITTKDTSSKPNSVPVSPNDKHRPSTRGKGSGSRGGIGRSGHSNSDVQSMMDSLSNY